MHGVDVYREKRQIVMVLLIEVPVLVVLHHPDQQPNDDLN